MKVILSRIFTPSIDLLTLSTRTRSLPNSRAGSKRIKGYLREEGLISSKVILSNCFLREVACLDFEALALKRATNSCNSLICSSFLALAFSRRRLAKALDSIQKS